MNRIRFKSKRGACTYLVIYDPLGLPYWMCPYNNIKEGSAINEQKQSSPNYLWVCDFVVVGEMGVCATVQSDWTSGPFHVFHLKWYQHRDPRLDCDWKPRRVRLSSLSFLLCLPVGQFQVWHFMVKLIFHNLRLLRFPINRWLRHQRSQHSGSFWLSTFILIITVSFIRGETCCHLTLSTQLKNWKFLRVQGIGSSEIEKCVKGDVN